MDLNPLFNIFFYLRVHFYLLRCYNNPGITSLTSKNDQIMRQPIKLIMKKGKVRRDGTSLIFVQYCYASSQRVPISTGIAIPPLFCLAD